MGVQASAMPQVRAWLAQQRDAIGTALDAAERADEPEMPIPRDWLASQLTELAAIEAATRRAALLLIAWSQREGVARPADVARWAEVTLSTVPNRARSAAAAELLEEVAGRS
jgi:hypothetical protein